jgi:hypothetical protein
MSLDTPFTLAKTVRLAPVEPHHAPLFCFALLTVSCALASFALACATPFAAFAVLAAAMLPLRPFPGNVLRKVRGAQGHTLDFGTAQKSGSVIDRTHVSLLSAAANALLAAIPQHLVPAGPLPSEQPSGESPWGAQCEAS